MITVVYSIRDVQTDTFAPPFLAATVGELDRMMLQSLEQESMLSRFPSDYAVYRIGEFDTSNGKMMPDDVPELHSQVQAYVSLIYTRRLAAERRQQQLFEESSNE